VELTRVPLVATRMQVRVIELEVASGQGNQIPIKLIEEFFRGIAAHERRSPWRAMVPMTTVSASISLA